MSNPIMPAALAYVKFCEFMAALPPPNEFNADIVGLRGAKHGEWRAALCTSVDELYRYIDLSFGDGRTEKDIPLPEIWPIAYLRRFIVNRRSRNKGHGARGMREFWNASRAKGARIAFVWIGREMDEDLEKNRDFYLRQGWTIIPADSEYEPILAYYEL
ncbi:MAG: hypothetical protein ABIS50_21140 [Luteolibacter sp.]|uniref:hypothetical protein n=1 Tax=Luteolibacter sp. TaxID=1962973 RepID=UPI0032653A9F